MSDGVVKYVIVDDPIRARARIFRGTGEFIAHHEVERDPLMESLLADLIRKPAPGIDLARISRELEEMPFMRRLREEAREQGRRYRMMVAILAALGRP